MTDSKCLPQKSTGDTGYSIARGLLASIPYFGGLATELFNLFLVSPYSKRFEHWMNMVANELDELRNAGFVRWQDLEGDERFITVLIQCTQVAIRHHQKKKIDLLLYAVSNTARQYQVKEYLESTFVRYIDELTPIHFNLLDYLFDEEERLAKFTSYEELLKSFIIDRGVQIEFEWFRLCCSDLESRHLVQFSPQINDIVNVYNPGSILDESDDVKPMLKVNDIGVELLSFVKKRDKKEP